MSSAQSSEYKVIPAIEGWNEFLDSLRDLAPKMLAKLPTELRGDPLIRQEIARLMLESLSANAIQAISGDPDRPSFLPMLNVTYNIGQPNADTNYRIAQISRGGTYRLRGRRGSLRLVKIGQLGPLRADGTTPGAAVVVKTFGYNDINALSVNEDDEFDVLLSPSKPDGHDCDWWQLFPETTTLVVRMVSSNWQDERDPTISIERIDLPAERPRRDTNDLAQRLATLSQTTTSWASMLVDHVSQLQREGYVNKFKIFDVSEMGALEGQYYYEGAFELGDDEALIVEAKMPKACGYASMILTNEIYETVDWYNNHSSLNDSQFHVDSDGFLRIVVASRDPGVPNWLDTAGNVRGAIQGRWTDCDSQPIPSARKVRISEIRGALPTDTPSVTPQTREQMLRDRRAALQQRPLW
jgi:hypothetical protein